MVSRYRIPLWATVVNVGAKQKTVDQSSNLFTPKDADEEAAIIAAGGLVYDTLGGTFPAAVSSFTAGAVGPTSLALAWTDPTSGSTPFTYRVGIRFANTNTGFIDLAGGLSANAYVATALLPATSYDFQITPYNALGKGPSTEIFKLTTGIASSPAPSSPPAAPTPPAPSPAPAPAPSPSPAPTGDSRPRYGIGSATAGVTTPAALLASMTPTGSNSSIPATFTVNPGAGQYGWFAVIASASTGGVTFTDALGTGGWQGASSAGNNGADDGSSPNTSTVTFNDGTNIWRFFRQSYAAAADTVTTS